MTGLDVPVRDSAPLSAFCIQNVFLRVHVTSLPHLPIRLPRDASDWMNSVKAGEGKGEGRWEHRRGG